MARRLRIQYPGARYHVINRGNYRWDVFGTKGSVKAFETALGEACLRHEWRLHAFVVMRNHFHLALETPRPNLVEGMHWLQSTFATRFNRFRSQHGHLFQGRYQSLLIEDVTALMRVVDYIHLNPVRAGVVSAADLLSFRGSSLALLSKPPRPAWLVATDLLTHFGLTDNAEGWSSYIERLAGRSSVTGYVKGEDRELSSGWAIGSHAWRRAIAKEHLHLALSIGIEAVELRDIKEAWWAETLKQALTEFGKGEDDIRREAKGAPWKIAIASKLRRQVNAPHPWIARVLNMGNPSSVRVYLSRASCLSPVPKVSQ